MSKSFLTIVQAFKDAIRGKNSRIELSEGTFTKDVIIDAPAREFENLYTRAEQISLEQSINSASELGLEKTALNFSKVRKGARRARGLIRFFKNQAPTSDITIAAGTVVSTLQSDSTNSVQFRTTQTITMRSALAVSYLNPTTTKYEIAVEIEAIIGGDGGNVGAGTIVSLSSTISGIDGIYNPFATAGGLNIETPLQLQTRLSNALAGTAIGSTAGFTSFILEQDAVEEVLVIGKGLTGRSEIGAVDIYVKGKLYRNFKDEFFDPFSPYPSFVFRKQPLISGSITSVLSSVSGILPVSSYTIVKDTGVYIGSILAQDKLQWVTSIGVSSGSVIVNYQYNGLIEDLQSILQTENQDVLNSSTLIKWATEIPIDVTINIRILSGFSGSDVATAVSTAISTFLSTLSIGQEVQQADVAREILNTSGVDDVTLPFTTFQSTDGTVVVNSNNNLTIPQTSYGSTGVITVNIT